MLALYVLTLLQVTPSFFVTLAMAMQRNGDTLNTSSGFCKILAWVKLVFTSFLVAIKIITFELLRAMDINFSLFHFNSIFLSFFLFILCVSLLSEIYDFLEEIFVFYV